jgi:hypothetical protein
MGRPFKNVVEREKVQVDLDWGDLKFSNFSIKNQKKSKLIEINTQENIKRNKTFENKKQKIVDLARTYIREDGILDMSSFRKEQPSAYSRINYYFNGVSGLIEQINPVKVKEKEKVKRASGRGCPINAQSVRNELAFDMLLLLRENYTLEEIGKMYGVSRAHIHQLLQVMDENTYLDERPVSIEMLVN